MAATDTVQETVAVPTGTWKSDPVHSHVGFSVKHMVVATFRGAFGDYEVILSDESGEPRLSGTVGVSSIEVKDENLYAHLLAPDFFDVERFPELTFSGRDAGDGRFQGELTIDLKSKGGT